MERLGLTIGLEDGSLRDSLALARRAEELGYTDLWSAEVGGADGFSPLAALGPVTSSVRLGTAIVPVFTRPPALTAMSAASVQDLSGGRFVLGLGTSSSIIVENWMGGSFEKPLKRLEEYVHVVRSALAGEKVTFDGDTVGLRGYRLTLPTEPPPIYIAALGPAACRLAGRVADGVIFFLKTASGVAQAMEWVAEGASAAGRSVDDLDVVIRLPILLDEPSDVRSVVARKTIVAYAMVDVYNRSLRAQGFDAEADAIASSWSAGDRSGAVRAVSGEMVQGLLLHEIDDLKPFRDAGVKTPILLPLTFDEDAAARRSKVEKAVERFAPRA